MDYSEGVILDLVGIVVFQELLEEMFWFFWVEDGKWYGDWWWWWRGEGVCVFIIKNGFQLKFFDMVFFLWIFFVW